MFLYQEEKNGTKKKLYKTKWRVTLLFLLSFLSLPSYFSLFSADLAVQWQWNLRAHKSTFFSVSRSFTVDFLLDVVKRYYISKKNANCVFLRNLFACLWMTETLTISIRVLYRLNESKYCDFFFPCLYSRPIFFSYFLY